MFNPDGTYQTPGDRKAFWEENKPETRLNRALLFKPGDRGAEQLRAEREAAAREAPSATEYSQAGSSDFGEVIEGALLIVGAVVLVYEVSKYVYKTIKWLFS